MTIPPFNNPEDHKRQLACIDTTAEVYRVVLKREPTAEERWELLKLAIKVANIYSDAKSQIAKWEEEMK